MKTFIALAAMLLATSPAMAQGTLSGHPEVIDGDTIKLDGRILRLAGIDAPELSQSLGQWSKYQLEDIIRGRVVVCTWGALGYYRRPLAYCNPVLVSGALSTVHINKLMVRAGAAYIGKNNRTYERQQTLAMESCKGLWSGDKLPWCYRKGLRK